MSEDLRRVGLLVNPQAGSGPAANLRAARQALAALRPAQVVTGPGPLGADALNDWHGAATVLPAPRGAGREQTLALAREIAAQAVAALVVVGGDGTLADAAFALLGSAGAPPLLGIGAGTMNVGPLITCPAAQAARLDAARLRPQSVDGVLAYANADLLGVGFNDGVIGFTVIALVGGQRRDVSAAELMQGRVRPAPPRSIAAPQAKVTWISSEQQARVLAEGMAVGALAVGFARPAFRGQAVAGGVCLTALAGLPAGCLVSDQPLARVDVEAAALLAWPPVASRYASLGAGSRIEVEGLATGASLCADGSPLWVLGNGDHAAFAIERGAATVLRLAD